MSDAITALLADARPHILERFHGCFLDASLGVMLVGVPANAHGTFQISENDDVTIAFVDTPDGRRMVKACADPKVFVHRFAFPINAEMKGRELLEMVLKVSEIDGVLVCSANSFHSVPIGKEEAIRVLSHGLGGSRDTR